MNRKLIILILTSVSIPLLAMKRIDLNDELWVAVEKGNIPEIQRLLTAGAVINPDEYAHNPLYTAIMSPQLTGEHRLKVLEFLLSKGAIADQYVAEINGTPLQLSAQWGTAPEVALLLTFIPLQEKEKILKERHVFNSIYYTRELVPDMRRFLTKVFINSLVDDQMQRIERVLAMKDYHKKTVRDYGLENLANNEKEIGELLDLNNPASREKIRKQVRNNVKRILFGAPKKAPSQFAAERDGAKPMDTGE